MRVKRGILLLFALSCLLTACGEIPTEVELKPVFKEKAWERYNFLAETLVSYSPEGIVDDFYLAGSTVFVEEVDKYVEDSTEADMNIYIEKAEEITHSPDGEKITRPGSMDGIKHKYVRTYLGEKKNFDMFIQLPVNENFSLLQPVFPSVMYKQGVKFSEKKVLYFGGKVRKPIEINLTYKVMSIGEPYDDCITFDVKVSSDTMSQKQGKPGLPDKTAETAASSPPARGADGMIIKNDTDSAGTTPVDIPLTVKGEGTYYYDYKENRPFSHKLNITLDGKPEDFGIRRGKDIERVTIRISASLSWKK